MVRLLRWGDVGDLGRVAGSSKSRSICTLKSPFDSDADVIHVS